MMRKEIREFQNSQKIIKMELITPWYLFLSWKHAVWSSKANYGNILTKMCIYFNVNRWD